MGKRADRKFAFFARSNCLCWHLWLFWWSSFEDHYLAAPAMHQSQANCSPFFPTMHLPLKLHMLLSSIKPWHKGVKEGIKSSKGTLWITLSASHLPLPLLEHVCHLASLFISLVSSESFRPTLAYSLWFLVIVFSTLSVESKARYIWDKKENGGRGSKLFSSFHWPLIF